MRRLRNGSPYRCHSTLYVRPVMMERTWFRTDCCQSAQAKALLNGSMHDSVGVLGLDAYYDRTTFSAFSSLVTVSGFEILYYFPGYYSSSYV